MPLKINEERKGIIRLVRKNPVTKLGQDQVTTGDTSHSHINKDSLDRLTIGADNNLLIDGNLIDPLLRQEDW